jgi:hypothetical protein
MPSFTSCQGLHLAQSPDKRTMTPSASTTRTPGTGACDDSSDGSWFACHVSHGALLTALLTAFHFGPHVLAWVRSVSLPIDPPAKLLSNSAASRDVVRPATSARRGSAHHPSQHRASARLYPAAACHLAGAHSGC